MKALFAFLLFAVSASANAQTADAIYKQACGPKDASFDVEQVLDVEPSAAPEPGKALVYFIQKESGRAYFTTMVGLDGSWVGVIHDSNFFVSVVPGEHHACAATQDRKHPGVELSRRRILFGPSYEAKVRSHTIAQGCFHPRLKGEFQPILHGRSHLGENLPRLTHAESIGIR